MNSKHSTVIWSKFLLIGLTVFFINCSNKNGDNPPVNPPPPPPSTNEVDFWLTKADQTIKMEKQNTILAFKTPSNPYPSIEIDETTSYQTVDGFGYTLTGGSAEVINS